MKSTLFAAGLILSTLTTPGGIRIPDAIPPGAVTVCSEGCDYTFIQDAVDAVEPGGTILLGPETFYENVVTTRSLTIRGARAERTVIDGMFAGRVVTFGGDLHLADLTITHGGHSLGGGVGRSFGRSQLTIENCHVVDNVAYSSVWAFGGGVFSRGRTRIIGSLIANNRASDAGGGVAVTDRLEIVDSTIINNSAYAGGGVGWLEPVYPVRIERSLITQNQARGLGGGVLAGSLEMLNSTVTENRSTWSEAQGGGIFVLLESIIKNSTISDNSPDGIHIYGGNTQIDHVILAGNEHAQCTGFTGHIVSAGHNLSSDFSCGLDGSGDQEGADPMLMPLGDYGGSTRTCPLHPYSPAIDAGGATCLPTDQRGVQRPFDGDLDGEARCDIGAFEFGVRGEATIPIPDNR